MLASLKAMDDDLDAAFELARMLQLRHGDKGGPYALEAELKLRQGDLAGASDAYDLARAKGPNRGYAARAHAIRLRLDRDDAAEPLIEYIDDRPADSTARLLLANFYQTEQQLDDAITEYEKVLAELPTNAVALNNLAWNYYVVGDDRAENTARRAYELMPDNGSITDTLGWILVERGSLEEGVALLRKAVELSDGRAEVRYHLAVGLNRLGQTEEARRKLVEILDSGQEFASKDEARQLLADL